MAPATGAALVVALFLGGPTLPGVALDGGLGAAVAFAAFFLKVLLVLLLLALLVAGVAVERAARRPPSGSSPGAFEATPPRSRTRSSGSRSRRASGAASR